jgi:hypothetical protein
MPPSRLTFGCNHAAAPSDTVDRIRRDDGSKGMHFKTLNLEVDLYLVRDETDLSSLPSLPGVCS